MPKIFALIDANSFYASCEKLFRPDLQKKPVVVLSNNDGCIVSACKLAKQIPQVKNFLPYYQIRDCLKENGVEVFSSNYALYADISKRLMNSLAKFSPEMEIYSIDEAFLDLSGILSNGSFEYDYFEYGIKIKNTIEKNIGIPVSVGIATTKVLAKAANRLAKKNTVGVMDFTNNECRCDVDQMLTKIDVSDLWGIGHRQSQKLRELAIHNARDFRDYQNINLIQKKLTKVGRQIQDELRGNVCFTLEKSPADSSFVPRKSITSSRTFGRPVFSKDELNVAIANYISTAAEKLRKQKSLCRYLTIYVRTNPFKGIEQYYNFNSTSFLSATNDTRKMIFAASKLLDKIYRSGIEYKKCGVILSDISSENTLQLSLFEEGDTIKDRLLMKNMDKINTRNGERILKVAACGTTDLCTWKMQQQLKSPAYTTRFSELPIIKLC
ncbi:MAG: Y-family DNA polymerase [Oligoflexia bacterium]|nr:Y-family DNA polymerase [Oligoflexia bacterium]